MFKTDNQSFANKLERFHKRLTERNKSSNSFGWEMQVWEKGGTDWYWRKQRDVDNSPSNFIKTVNEVLGDEYIDQFQIRMTNGITGKAASESWEVFIINEKEGALRGVSFADGEKANEEKAIDLDKHSAETLIELFEHKASNMSMMEKLRAMQEADNYKRRISDLERDLELYKREADRDQRDLKKDFSRDKETLNEKIKSLEESLKEAKEGKEKAEKKIEELEKDNKELSEELKKKSSLARQIGTGIAASVATTVASNIIRKPQIAGQVQALTGIDVASLFENVADEPQEETAPPPTMGGVEFGEEESQRTKEIKEVLNIYVNDLTDEHFSRLYEVIELLGFPEVFNAIYPQVKIIYDKIKDNTNAA